MKLINLEKEIREQPQVLTNVLAQNESVFSDLIAKIREKKPQHVYFAARGTSDHASIYAQYLFAVFLGIPCGLSTPSVVSHYGAKMHYDSSVVIGVSQSGAAKDVMAVISDANRDGAITVAVTNTPSSELAGLAQYHLCCSAGPEYSIAATKTFTSQMYLLANLVALWSGNKELKAQLAKVPAAVGELLASMPEQIEKIVPRYRYLTDAIVLGRGLLYPIALEGALKILETNRIRMKGYPVSDFYHGPFAQISENELVFLMAGEGPCFEDANAMLMSLTSVDAEIIVITDNAELANRPLSLKIPETGSDIVSAYLMAVTMQLFALKLCEVRGIDPDNSKVLKKITVTK